MLLTATSVLQESPTLQRQAYITASTALLTAYLKEQHSWNHYFTTIAPDQSTSQQIKPQEAYRRFLADTLSQWRQMVTETTCQSPHLLYELALFSYGVAADFRLAFLHASNTPLGSRKATDVAEERARHYTAMGDNYFKQAAALAQANSCVGTPP
jgi:hypothetical protein